MIGKLRKGGRGWNERERVTVRGWEEDREKGREWNKDFFYGAIAKVGPRPPQR
jgi:hypothetical protein